MLYIRQKLIEHISISRCIELVLLDWLWIVWFKIQERWTHFMYSLDYMLSDVLSVPQIYIHDFLLIKLSMPLQNRKQSTNCFHLSHSTTSLRKSNKQKELCNPPCEMIIIGDVWVRMTGDIFIDNNFHWKTSYLFMDKTPRYIFHHPEQSFKPFSDQMIYQVLLSGNFKSKVWWWVWVKTAPWRQIRLRAKASYLALPSEWGSMKSRRPSDGAILQL